MIDIVNVTKRFGKFTALSGMNLSVGCSSIYGLVGYGSFIDDKIRFICPVVGFRFLPGQLFMSVNGGAVSYTHLDVYKRQV